MLAIKATQQIEGIAVGDVTDKRGNPTTVQSVTVTSTDPTIVNVVDNGDGTSTARATGPVGTATIVVDADADLGDGVRSIQGTLEVQVVAGDAAVLNVRTGAITEQADAPTPPADGGGGVVPPPPPADGGV